METRLAPTVGLISNPAWEAEGPFPIFGGQTEGLTAQNNPVSGAINRVIAHPTNPDILYAGAVNGGVWKTTNGTASSPNWTPLSDTWGGMSIGALEMDSTDPTGNTLIAGLGRFSSLARFGGPLSGAYKTTDGGQTWTPLAASLQGKNIVGAAIRGNTILVAVNVADNYQFSNTGMFRSTDGGASFTQVSIGTGAATGLPAGISYDLAHDPVNPSVFYANIQLSNSSGTYDGIYKTTNTGATWTRVSTTAMNGVLDGLGSNNAVNIKIAVGKANNVFVAATDNSLLTGMYYSPDGGSTWQTMGAPSSSDGNAANGAFPGGKPQVPQTIPGTPGAPGGQGNTHFSLAADPANKFMVYLGGDRQNDPFPNSLGARNYSGRLFRGDASKAVGGQWTAITNDFADPDGSGPASGTSPHADSRDMAFDAAGNLIETDDGGIYRRSSPTLSTGVWSSVNGSLQVTEFHSVAYDPVSNVIIGGTQDTGTPFQQQNGTWTTFAQGDGGVVAVDTTSVPGSSVRYSSYIGLQNLARSTHNSSGNLVGPVIYPGLIVAGTGGKNLQAVDNNVGFYQAMELNAVDQARVVIPTTRVYVSTDRAENLTDLTGSTNQGLTAVAYGGRRNGLANPDLLIFGGPGSASYQGGARLFTITSSGGPVSGLSAYAGGTPDDITLDPENSDTMCVLDSSGKVWSTTNAGTSWSNITGNLPALGTSNPAAGEIQFVRVAGLPSLLVGGANGGVYQSFLTDPGVWTRMGTGLPNACVDDIRYDATDDVLLVGTQGRGAFTVPGYSTLAATLVIKGDETPSADDVVLLARNAANSALLDVTLNSNLIASIPLVSISSIQVDTGGGNDTLVADYGTLGMPEIQFNAGTGSNDSLVLQGANAAGISHAITGVGGGTIALSGGLTGTVDYTGVEPVDISAIQGTTHAVTLPSAGSAVTLANSGSALSLAITGHSGSFKFANPSVSLAMASGHKSDSLVLGPALTNLTATVSVGSLAAPLASVVVAGAIQLAGSNGLALNGLAVAVNAAVSSGPVAILADTLDIPSGGSLAAGTSGITVGPLTAGRAVDLGGADVGGTTLGISVAEVGRMTAGAISVGSSSAGKVRVTADITRATATNIALSSGSGVSLAGGKVISPAGTLVVSSGPGGTFQPETPGADLSVVSVSLGGSTLGIRADGPAADTQYSQLRVNGTANITGSTLSISGSAQFADGDVLTIVSASGVVGQFQGLANGAMIPFGGLNLRLEYLPAAVTLTAVGPPRITSPATFVATYGTPTTHQVVASGFPQTFTYSLAGTIPAGVSIGATTGVLDIPGTLPTGSYPFDIIAANGIGLPDTQAFTIQVAKRDLTVTAESKEIVFNGLAFSGFTSTVAGFVNGDLSSVVTGSISYTGPATTATLPGTYAVLPDVSGLSAANYAFVSAAGILTIRNLVTLQPLNSQFVNGGRNNLASLELLAVFEAPGVSLTADRVGVTGGTVTAVTRETPADDTRWVITVAPALDSFQQADVAAFIKPDTVFTAGLLGNPQSNTISCHVDRAAPVVVSVNRLLPAGQLTNTGALAWRVSFNEPLNGSTLGTSDFTLSATGTVMGTLASVTSADASGQVFDIQVNGVTGDGVARVDFTGSVADTVGNVLTDPFASGQDYTVDHTAPAISTISRHNPAGGITNRQSVIFRLTLGEAANPVTVSKADFSVHALAGTPGGFVNTVTPVGSEGTRFDIMVSNIIGNGEVRLDYTGSLSDMAGNALSTPFNSGDSYQIDRESPIALAITRVGAASTVATTAEFRVAFNEAVDYSSIGVQDFALSFTGSAGGIIAGVLPVSGNPSAILVQVSGLTGAGDVGVQIPNGAQITDLAGNNLFQPFSSGETVRLEPVLVTVNPSSVTEGFTIVSSVSLDRTLDQDVGFVVTPTIRSGAGAAGPGDFNATPLALTIPAGSLAITFGIATTADVTVELDETFLAVLGSVGATGRNVVVVQPTAVQTILNDDVTTLELEGGAATEGSYIEFTARLGLPVDKDVAFSFGITGSVSDTASCSDPSQNQSVTATLPSGSDLSFQTGVITIPSGTLYGTFRIQTTQDQVVELNESITVGISGLSAFGLAVSFGTQSAVGTIVNDDTASITLVSGSALEGLGVPVGVVLDKAVDTDLTLTLTPGLAAGDTAGAGDVSTQALTVFIPSGTLTGSVLVPTVNDNLVELNETFSILGSNLASRGRDVSILPGAGVGTILNDDKALLRVAPLGAVKGHAAVFTARLGTGSPTEVTARMEDPFPGFKGELSIAQGDVNGDGFTDTIFGAGAGLVGGQVKVIDGATGFFMTAFTAFPGHAKGVVVAIGDINRDGRKDIVVAAQGTAGLVRVFDSVTLARLRSITAYKGYSGALAISAGDINGDRFDDVAVTASNGRLRVFSGANGSLLRNITTIRSGNLANSVVMADLNGDGIKDIVVGAASGGSGVAVYAGAGGVSGGFNAFNSSFKKGVRLAAIDINGDGIDELVVVTGPGVRGQVRIFNSAYQMIDEFFATQPGVVNGLFIG